MKTLITLSILLSATLAQAGFGRDRIGGIRERRKAQLTPISWAGTLQCDEKVHDAQHQKDHECSLEFVDDLTGRSWNVKGDSSLLSLHQQKDGALNVRIDGVSSPRYLLGGSYVKIDRIQVMDNASKADKTSESAQTTQPGS